LLKSSDFLAQTGGAGALIIKGCCSNGYYRHGFVCLIFQR
jgi:hypothetical protein